MGTIRKRGSRWEAQIRRRGLPEITKTFARRTEADAWVAVVESEVVRGVYQDRSLAAEFTFGDLLGRYALEVTPTKKGAHAERCQIEAMRRDPLARIVMSDLAGRDVADWRDRRLQEVSGSTVNRGLNLISHVLNTARREWGVPIDNPVSSIRRPRNNRARRTRLSAADETKLLSALECNDRGKDGRLVAGARNHWMRPIVITAIETGMRRSEILSMLWNDVDLGQQVVHLHDTKNGDSRDVPLSRRAIGELSALDRDPSGKVFPISPESVKKAFTRAAKRAGFDDLHFHDLRHEATCRLSKRLSNVLELSAATGHKTLSMLQRYYHPDASELARKLG